MMNSRTNASPKKYGIFTAFEEPIVYSPVSARRAINNHPLIVKADQLDSLLSRTDSNKQGYKILRFLLRTNGELVFAAEGTPGEHIPTHYQMADSDFYRAACLTAGNVYFGQDTQLKIIDHKSGDFKPPFHTLQFALPAFAETQLLTTTKVITINELTESGMHKKSYHLTRDAILMPSETMSVEATTDEFTEIPDEVKKRLQGVEPVRQPFLTQNHCGIFSTSTVQRQQVNSGTHQNSQAVRKMGKKKVDSCLLS